MDVDTSENTSAQNPEEPKPTVDEANPDSPGKSPKDRLISLLDQVEKHVERLRRDALKLEEEKDTLLTTLDTLKNSEMLVDLNEGEREEVIYYAELISNRCLSVELEVKTVRDTTQQEALYQVNSFIDSLVISLREDPFGTKMRCVSFMNACSSRSDSESDKNFETAILGCTLDDQKRVKKRLQGLMDYIDKSAHFC